MRYNEYTEAVLQTGAFDYQSIRDGQLQTENRVYFGAAVCTIIIGMFFPPVGLALGTILGGMQIVSAANGKDLISGRELSTGEQITRGIFGTVGVLGGLSGLNAFSQNTAFVRGTEPGTLNHYGEMAKHFSRAKYTELNHTAQVMRSMSVAPVLPKAKQTSSTKNIITNGAHHENGKLRSNSKYTTGEHSYVYETNSEGAISHANTSNLKLKSHKGRIPHNPNTLDKLPGDQAGHVFADRFGGSGELDNLVSQAKKVNLSSYKKLENTWTKAIEQGKKVTVDININYAKDSLRPISFEVNYTVDNIDFYEFISN